MSIQTVAYEDFITSNQGTVEVGGPWVGGSTSADLFWLWPSRSWCGGYCLSFRVAPLNDPPTYHGSFITNISVNLANYGGATSLDFTWSIWPLYRGSNTTAGSEVPIASQVGDAVFGEDYPTVDFTAFSAEHQWDNASKISHSGSTSVVRGSDPNRGYIAIMMNVSMGYSAADHNETLEFYVKDIKFLITTPIQSATAASSSSTSSSSTSSSSTSSAPAGVVAGAVIGALAFAALFILAICLFRRRHKKEENPVDDTVIFKEHVNHEAPTPMEESPVPTPHLATRYPMQPSSSSFLRPVSFGALGPYGPPPRYGPNELTGQESPLLTPSSPELARFAAANRDSINDNLEARLQAAGYLPTEDPSRLTPEEWRNEYGITKLELRRLQTLYARTQQDQPQ